MEREYQFRALTSNKDVEIKPVTQKAFEFAIDDNSEVTNVAITGNYGAGKSSVVESFERKRKDKRFIHISLGQYDEIKSSEKNGLDKREINTIEGKIINQLLHQIDPNKIRRSIFKTLDAESQIKPFNISVYVSLVLLLSLYLLNISSWNGLIQNFSWLSWTTKPIISLLVLVILFVLIVYGFYFLLKLQKDFGFIKKLSLKAEKIETDIEIFSNESSRVSYFDRYLDDILYLFKRSEADVIVFEDIERFNDSRIFEKLKELNIVINRNRKANNKRKLVFFYLVKDDLFESQERTKFFDFIIPIVPVVTASNSHDILKKLLTEMWEYDSLD
ncbi:YobI family P-loop NTPase, partial [Streptococcus oralis]